MFTQFRPKHRQGSRQGRGRTGLVASTQQLLVLGVVLAALVPAGSVVDLKVVHPGQQPVSDSGSVDSLGSMAGYVKAATTPSTVPVGQVTAKLKEIALTAPLPKGVRSGRGIVGRLTAAATKAQPKPRTTVVTSAPQPVPGFGTIGLTWAKGAAVSSKDMTADVRTLKDGRWSAWQKLDVDDHGPDPGSAEAANARPGTMEAIVGRVDKVQTRMRLTKTQQPADLKLAVITAGTPTATKSEKPAIDTDPGDTATSGAPAPAAPVGGSDDVARTTAATTAGGSDTAALSAAAYTPKPKIYSRAQWGANEKVREQTPPDYNEIHGGFVHHTVNTNNYTRADVPGIIRSIYTYHVKSRGWRDIGYNFLIDKFGRIWEGRYGGVDRPVVGAHTENYNSWGFGASAIGNYDVARPSSAMIQAFGALFAWKLSLHGVKGNAGTTTIGPRTFAHAIMGHRDTKSTACPGKYLYAQIPTIRSKAGALQKGWAARELQSQQTSTKYPDVLARQKLTGRIYTIPTTGTAHFLAARPTNLIAPTAVTIMNAGDWDRDGHGDVLIQFADGTIRFYKGNGGTTYQAGVIIGRNFQKASMIDVVSDMTGDGYPDIEGRHPNGEIRIWPGHGAKALGGSYKSHSGISGATVQIGAGRWNTDGAPDVIFRVGNSLEMYPGNGPGGIMSPHAVTGVNLNAADAILAVKDLRGASTGSDLLVHNAVTGMFTAYEHKQAGGWSRVAYMNVENGYDLFG